MCPPVKYAMKLCRRRAHHVASCIVLHALRLACGSGGVQQEQRMLCWHPLWFAIRTLNRNNLIVPKIPFAHHLRAFPRNPCGVLDVHHQHIGHLHSLIDNVYVHLKHELVTWFKPDVIDNVANFGPFL